MYSRLTEEAAGGLAAGLLGTLIGFPLDVIKTRLQTTGGTGIWSTGRSIVQSQGVPALYRGVLPPLISLSILNTCTFSAYSYFQDSVYGATRGWDWRNAAAGATCAPAAALVSTVENLLKTQLQVHGHPQGPFRSTWDCGQQLTRRGRQPWLLYTGHAINTVREMVFLQTYFFTYEGLRSQLQQQSSGSAVVQQWAVPPVAGGLSGALAWTISFPLDCVRAGVQGQALVDGKARLTAWAVGKALLQTRGLLGFYAGVAPSIARAFLVSGSRFSAYEVVLYWLRGGRDVGRNHHHS